MKLIIDISKDRYDEIMAMDWLNCRRFFDEELRAIHDGIPQRTERWIPVSERLPEKNDVYLVAVNSFGCPTRDVDGFMANTDRKWELYGNKVIAWMQLPPPYQSEIPTGAEGSEKE